MTKKGEAQKWLNEMQPPNSDECMAFPFARTEKGYGHIRYKNKVELAHRVVCKKFHGDPPDERPLALHSCGNGHLGCINPNHLYWGDNPQNWIDSLEHGTAALGERNGKSVLTEGLVRYIRGLSSKGYHKAEIAKITGAHEGAIRSVLIGRTWKWVR